MAHFAELDENNIVTQVIVVDNNELLVDGIESEAKGIDFCVNLLGGTWIQTSYSGTIRKNYAGIGYTYDPILDAFYLPQPYPSWELDEDAKWQPPVAYPTDGKTYLWDEEILQWVEITDTIQTNQPDEADLTEGTN
jgi:hypothetical protein